MASMRKGGMASMRRGGDGVFSTRKCVARSSSGSQAPNWVFSERGSDGAGGIRKLGEAEASGLVLHAAIGGGPATAAAVPYGYVAGDHELNKVPELKFSPRRTKAVRFTCNRCGHRTERRINPHAYANGTVFVQCSGCLAHHKLIDNLNLYHEVAEMEEEETTTTGSSALNGKMWFRLGEWGKEGNESK